MDIGIEREVQNVKLYSKIGKFWYDLLVSSLEQQLFDEPW